MGDEFPTKFLIDGIDRLGKSSLIKRIQDELGYHLVIHYDKPKLLANYLTDAEYILENPRDTDYGPEYSSLNKEQLALRLYQDETNNGMFDLLNTNTPIIFDRTHLGECVYAPLYRGYDGSYVFNLERDYVDSKMYTVKENVRLILLTTSHFEMLQDDGQSFNFANKEKEQQLFIDAFNKSSLPNKVIVDVHNGSKGYKSFDEIFREAIYKDVSK